MRIKYKDGVRYTDITGYGCLSRNFLVGLSELPNVEIHRQIFDDKPWENVEPHLKEVIERIPGWNHEKYNVTLHLMPPPFIEKEEGLNFCYTQNAISRLPPLWLEKLKEMDLVIVPSEFDFNVFKAEGLKNVEIVPQSSDYSFYLPLQNKATTPFIFLNVGTFNFRKGQDILIKAFELAFGEDNNVRLWFKTGRGNYQVLFQNLLNNLGISGNNMMLDDSLASPMEMAQLYNKVNCVVNPSRGEGWNMPITEGMCCELPVISTYATAMLDYMTDQNSYKLSASSKAIKDYEQNWWNQSWLNGYASIPDGCLYESNPLELSAILKEVYESESDKGKIARQDIIEKWSWDSAVKKLYNVITKYL